jgi:hypothetical protein
MATSASLTFPTPLQLKNLADPTSPQDAATKAYADTLKVDPTKIANGTSNLAITTINGNVTVSVGGTDNVLTITPNGTVVKGSRNTTGNLITSGNLFAGLPGTNVYLGNVNNVRVYGGTSGQFLKLTTAAASTTVSVSIPQTDPFATITVGSTTGFPSSGYIIVDSEVIAYTGITTVSPFTFTGCIRAQLNSILAPHATSATVYSYNGGTLDWAPLDATKIINGTSNVSVSSLNGPVIIGVNSVPSVATFNSTGVNIAGYANINSGTLTASTPVSFVQTWNNASTTFTGILGNITNTASNATAISKLIDLQVGGASKFSVDMNGNISVGTGAGGTLAGLYALSMNNLNITGAVTGNSNVSSVLGNLGIRTVASTYTDGVALASATIANAAVHAIGQPTLAASNTGVTFTNASTLYIANVPLAGTNATLTNKYALYIGNGNSYFNGNIISTNQLISTLADGTAPLVVTSKTVVTNLHANLSDYSTVTTTAAGATNYLTFANASSTSGYQLFSNANLSFNATNGTLFSNNVSVSNQLISTLADGTAPLVVTSKSVVTNLHANLSDYSNVTAATTGTYYPTFVSGNTTSDYQKYVSSKLSFNAATGNLNATILSATDLTLTGNLIVSGTTTTINSTTTRLVDPITELGGGANGAALTTDDNKDRGLLLHYHTGTAVADAFMGWDNSNNEFGFGRTVSVASEEVTWTDYGNIRANVYFGNGASLTNVAKPADTFFIGSTSIALNRATASQALTGITSIDGNANIASHLMGGVAGGIPYQTAVNTTTMLAAGTDGQYLKSTGSAIQWSTLIIDKIVSGTSNINVTATTINTVIAGTVVSSLSASGISITPTWNSVSTRFTGILENVTDTTSDPSSKLMDLQVAFATKFNVDKTGNVYVGNNLTVAGSFSTTTLNGTLSSPAQPYITSLGALTGLAVSNSSGVVNFITTANVSLGNVSNLHITGGTPGAYLSTNGSGGLSWITPAIPTSANIGTTSIAFNRASAAQTLTGITSIDGSAASLTTPRNINGIAFNGTGDITVTANAQTLTGTSLPAAVIGSSLTSVGTLTGLTVAGITSVQGIAETLISPTFGVSTTYNLATATLFYHASGSNPVTSSFTAAFTNTPAVGAGLSRTIVATIIIAQGGTAYIPNAVSVNGTTYTIKWYGSTVPTGLANAIDMFSFTIIVFNGGVAAVTGTYATYL